APILLGQHAGMHERTTEPLLLVLARVVRGREVRAADTAESDEVLAELVLVQCRGREHDDAVAEEQRLGRVAGGDGQDAALAGLMQRADLFAEQGLLQIGHSPSCYGPRPWQSKPATTGARGRRRTLSAMVWIMNVG